MSTHPFVWKSASACCRSASHEAEGYRLSSEVGGRLTTTTLGSLTAAPETQDVWTLSTAPSSSSVDVTVPTPSVAAWNVRVPSAYSRLLGVLTPATTIESFSPAKAGITVRMPDAPTGISIGARRPESAPSDDDVKPSGSGAVGTSRLKSSRQATAISRSVSSILASKNGVFVVLAGEVVVSVPRSAAFANQASAKDALPPVSMRYSSPVFASTSEGWRACRGDMRTSPSKAAVVHREISSNVATRIAHVAA